MDGAAQSAQRPGVLPDRAGRGSSGPVSGGRAVVPLGRLRTAVGGAALAGAGGAAGRGGDGGRAVPAEGAVGARLRGDPPGRHGARAGGAPGVPEEAERSANPTAVAYASTAPGVWPWLRTTCRVRRRCCGPRCGGTEIGELNSNVLMGQVELAMTRAFQGDLPEAVRLCEDVRQVCEDHGERWARGYALYVLAYAAWSDGEPGRARELLADCLAGAHRFRDQLGSVLAGGTAGPGHRGGRNAAGGGGAAGRGGADVAVGGPAVVRLGATTTRRTSCARRRRGSSWATSGTRSACGTGRGSAAGRRCRGRCGGPGRRPRCRRRAGAGGVPRRARGRRNPPPRPPGRAGRRRAEVPLVVLRPARSAMSLDQRA